jgi:hypothetical protein
MGMTMMPSCFGMIGHIEHQPSLVAFALTVPFAEKSSKGY